MVEPPFLEVLKKVYGYGTWGHGVHGGGGAELMDGLEGLFQP